MEQIYRVVHYNKSRTLPEVSTDLEVRTSRSVFRSVVAYSASVILHLLCIAAVIAYSRDLLPFQNALTAPRVQPEQTTESVPIERSEPFGRSIEPAVAKEDSQAIVDTDAKSSGPQSGELSANAEDESVAEPPSDARAAIRIVRPDEAPRNVPAALAGAKPVVAPLATSKLTVLRGAARAALGEYTAVVAKMVERERRYPQAAISRRLEGNVAVNITIGTSGAIESATIFKPSVFAEFNQATLEAVHRVGSFPPLPDEIGEDEVTVRVPLHYSDTSRQR